MSLETEQRASSASDTAERHPMSRLHPAKVRAGIRRRWFEYRMERTPLTPCDGVVELGNKDYGGWTLPDGLIEPSWVCYSVGAGGEISFDLDLIARYGVTVRSIDPVPRYVERALA